MATMIAKDIWKQSSGNAIKDNLVSSSYGAVEIPHAVTKPKTLALTLHHSENLNQSELYTHARGSM